VSRPLERVGVVVPAHDEQDWLEACLDALTRAIRWTEIPVDIVVVADACTDDTVEVARSAGVDVVEIAARNVGRARATGWDRLRREPADTQWLATTDADTLVPEDWLVRMVGYANRGWDAVVGTVTVQDWATAGRPDSIRSAWQARYARARDHVHGANLGVRASCYATVGGVPARTLAEDVGLVAALTASGARVLIATDLPVLTSARHSTRAPGGFASYLDDLTDDVSA
jgi:glycosyltransferase involved in cell wall biosynthesis